MRPKYYVPIVLLLLVVAFGIYLYTSRAASCAPRDDDPEGYLFKICNYIKAHDIDVSPANPAKYSIIKIEEGQHQEQEVLIIYLDCCYMGDRAFVDKKSGEVVDFSLGPQ